MKKAKKIIREEEEEDKEETEGDDKIKKKSLKGKNETSWMEVVKKYLLRPFFIAAASSFGVSVGYSCYDWVSRNQMLGVALQKLLKAPWPHITVFSIHDSKSLV